MQEIDSLSAMRQDLNACQPQRMLVPTATPSFLHQDTLTLPGAMSCAVVCNILMLCVRSSIWCSKWQRSASLNHPVQLAHLGHCRKQALLAAQARRFLHVRYPTSSTVSPLGFPPRQPLVLLAAAARPLMPRVVVVQHLLVHRERLQHSTCPCQQQMRALPRPPKARGLVAISAPKHIHKLKSHYLSTANPVDTLDGAKLLAREQ